MRTLAINNLDESDGFVHIVRGRCINGSVVQNSVLHMGDVEFNVDLLITYAGEVPEVVTGLTCIVHLRSGSHVDMNKILSESSILYLEDM